VPRTEAQEIKVAMTSWELEQTLAWCKGRKFTMAQEEDRILNRRFHDRLEKVNKPTLPGTD